MANRIFLAQIPTEDTNHHYTSDAIVAAANYMLPVLWALAFAPGDVSWRDLPEGTEVVDDDGEPTDVTAYPVLLTRLDAAQQRSRERRDLFFRAFPCELDEVYNGWLALLDGIETPYLLVDTLELWGMGEPDDFEPFLIECTSAFENDDPRYWSMLLTQAAIERDETSSALSFNPDEMPYLLRGYGWMRAVPWAE